LGGSSVPESETTCKLDPGFERPSAVYAGVADAREPQLLLGQRVVLPAGVPHRSPPDPCQEVQDSHRPTQLLVQGHGIGLYLDTC